MLAAAATLWSLFSLWLTAPLIALPRLLRQTAAALLIAELLLLFFFSYGTEGCDDDACAPFAQAAGMAARTDVPLLTAGFFVLTVYALARRGRPSRRSAAGQDDVVAVGAEQLDDDVAVVALQLDHAVLRGAADAAALLQPPGQRAQPGVVERHAGDRRHRPAAPPRDLAPDLDALRHR